MKILLNISASDKKDWTIVVSLSNGEKLAAVQLSDIVIPLHLIESGIQTQ